MDGVGEGERGEEDELEEEEGGKDEGEEGGHFSEKGKPRADVSKDAVGACGGWVPGAWEMVRCGRREVGTSWVGERTQVWRDSHVIAMTWTSRLHLSTFGYITVVLQLLLWSVACPQSDQNTGR